MKSYQYANRQGNIDSAIAFLVGASHKTSQGKRRAEDSLLYVKKMLEYIAVSYPADETVTIEVFGFFGDEKIRIFYKGEKLDTGDLIRYSLLKEQKAELSDVEALKLRKIYANYFGSSAVSHKYSDSGVNITTAVLRKSGYKNLLILLIALFGGIGVGLLLRTLLPEQTSAFVSGSIFSGVSKVFVNCVKMLIGPLMFFTISSSIASYTDLSALGRMGKNLVVRYFANAVIAMALSLGIILLLKPGVAAAIPSLESIVSGSSTVADTVANNTVSIKDTIMGFFPSNFFQAFVDSKMMQIIFISFLLGLAAGLLNIEAREGIHKFLSYGNQLFCKMVNIVMWFLPISVFCAMASTMIVMGIDTLLLLIKWVIALVIAFIVMAAILILLTMVFGRVKPSVFLKKYSEAILTTFAMGSCNASMPVCISAVEEKMGVSRKTSALTMPIGVSIHCASNCIFYLVSAFFLANLYTGVEVSPLMYPAVFFSVLVLGIGAPSIAGAGPICVAMLLPQLGVPMGLITLIIGLDPFISMFKAACSCIEDASVTLAIARSEKQLDESVLNS